MELQRNKIKRLSQVSGYIVFLIGILLMYLGGILFVHTVTFPFLKSVVFIGGSVPGVIVVIIGWRLNHFSQYITQTPLEEEQQITVKSLTRDYFTQFPILEKRWIALLFIYGVWLCFVVGKTMDVW